MLSVSIRTRMLVFSLALLAIPYVGYQYVREMEQFMRSGLEHTVLGTAKALAGALHDRPGLFPEAFADSADIHAHPLRVAPQLDGYDRDWDELAERTTPIPWRGGDKTSKADTPHYAAGVHGAHLYLLVRVPDRQQVAPREDDPLSGDHLLLRLIDKTGARHHYLFPTHSTGPIHARALELDALGQPIARKELRLSGRLRVGAGESVMELRVPLAMVGDRMGIHIADIDNRGSGRSASTASANGPLGLLVLPSAAIDNVINALGRTDGRRIWVVDAEARVLARGGSLWRPSDKRLHPWLALLLRKRGVADLSDPGPVDRMETSQVWRAAAGEESTSWQRSADGELVVVSAAHPIWSGQKVVGVVLVEESSTPIQIARSDALTQLLLTTLVVFALAATGLAWLATGLSRRLTRLKQSADNAIDGHGRVVGDIGEQHGRDEIGDLAIAFASLLTRLGEYNRYLERLASRLSHELRTPLAVIRSSLDNLELDPRPEVQADYLQRARSGIKRLQTIITRMSEASRIEETVRGTEPEPFDLAEVFRAAYSGYADVWPKQPFRLVHCPQSAPFLGTPDLIVQMLDKLAANAVDFHHSEHPIEFTLEAAEGNGGQTGYALRVTNFGARLPQDVGNRLFESMVSSRPRGDGGAEEPHLGLGLYVVRLVVEHHAGAVRAIQRDNPDAVTFEVWLPERSTIQSP